MKNSRLKRLWLIWIPFWEDLFSNNLDSRKQFHSRIRKFTNTIRTLLTSKKRGHFDGPNENRGKTDVIYRKFESSFEMRQPYNLVHDNSYVLCLGTYEIRDIGSKRSLRSKKQFWVCFWMAANKIWPTEKYYVMAALSSNILSKKIEKQIAYTSTRR